MRKGKRYKVYNAETAEFPPAKCEHNWRQMGGFVMVEGKVRGVCKQCYYAHPDVREMIAEKRRRKPKKK